MPRVLIPRAQAAEHQVQQDETLKQIFEEKCQPSGITWEEFAAYNFGTTETRAINRALVEQVGCSAIDSDDASKSKLDPALKPSSGALKLRIPKVWEALALEPRREHVLKIRRRVAPPGVSLTKLDRWFLPKKEACAIAYALDGSEELADKASLSVYASNYCTATVEDDGAITYPPAADLGSEVIWSKSLAEQAKPRGAAYAVDGWKGESGATRGVLKKRGLARYINVACSPYTVVVRFYKDDSDKDARIELAPFWPLFGADDRATTASLKIQWSIKGTTRTMERGQLLVTDKDDNVVLRQALAANEIAEGEFAWDAGQAVVKMDKMPYRAQLQVHTGDGEANGVALAAMHTEVRLWVHKDVKHSKKPDERIKDPQCLDLAVAPYVPAGVAPVKGSDPWYGLRLAELGYHPGPVDGDVNAADFKMALKELQRSYPKNTSSPYRRLASTGVKDVDTTNLLDGNRVVKRSRFGQIRSDDLQEPEDLDDRSAEQRLGERDHAQGLILWVDDLHCYTSGAIPAGCDPNVGLGDYRGAMAQANDGKVARDQVSICRPWIPLSVRPRILSRGDELTRDTAPAWDDAMAECIGPLRVDWAFTEVNADVKPIDKMLGKTAVQDGTKVRTLAAVKHVITKLAFEDDDKNKYVNCPKKHGGLRPDKKSELGDYYKDLFGIDAKSLKPWKAVDDATTKSVCSAAHDDVGQDEAKLFAGSVGRAGIYFHPSSIAGDGYCVRAEVSFAKFPGEGDHPNRAVLAARYPRRPVAHTCRLRVWRRTAIRGHVKWTRAQVNVPTTAENVFYHYRACHVHMVHSRSQPLIRQAKSLVDTSDGGFKDMIVGTMAKAPYTTKARLAFKDDYPWPWAGRKHFGIDEIPPPGDNVSFADYREKFLENVWKDTWELFRYSMLTHLLDKFEKEFALYRGHLTVGFTSTPEYYLQVYYCSDPAKHRNVLIETTSGGDSAVNDPCHVTGCGGQLTPGYRNDYRCPTCRTSYPDRHEASANSHPLCEKQCEGTKTPNVRAINRGPVRVTYTCDAGGCGERDVLDNQYHVNAYACGTYCGGNDHPTPLNLVRSIKDISDAKSHLPLAAVGSALGASFVFEGNDHLTWAHEMGHHRHMEHAAGAPGEKVKQHDSVVNPHLAGQGDLKPEEKRWDHGCIMGYVKEMFFCGKCVLKNRGWMVEDLPMLAEDKDGP